MRVNSHNKQFKQIRNAWHFWFESVLVFTAQWFRCGGSVAHYLIGRYIYIVPIYLKIKCVKLVTHVQRSEAVLYLIYTFY